MVEAPAPERRGPPLREISQPVARRRDRPDPDERPAERPFERGRGLRRRVPPDGGEQAIVLAAGRGQVLLVPAVSPGGPPQRRGEGKGVEVDGRPAGRPLHDPPQVGIDPVGDVHHGRDGLPAGRATPLRKGAAAAGCAAGRERPRPCPGAASPGRRAGRRPNPQASGHARSRRPVERPIGI